MSLILDALRKADNDRKLEESPSSIDGIYDNNNQGPSSARPTTHIAIVIGASIVFVLILIFVIYLSNQNSDKNDIVNIITDNTQVVQQPSSADRKNATNSSRTGDKKESTFTGVSVSALKQAQKNKQYANAGERLSNNAEVAHSAQRISDLYSNNRSDNIDAAPPKTSTTHQEAESQTTNRASQSTESSTGISTTSINAYTDLPLIKELLLSDQRAIPTMMYSEHDFVESGRSSVIINRKRYYESSTITAGIKVERILSDGLILRQNQKQFKMRALNSWINF